MKVPVRIKYSKKILFKTSDGSTALRIDEGDQSSVIFRDFDRDPMVIYHFRNRTPVYSSPYLNWENAYTLTGFADDDYLKSAVKNGKKLFATVSYTTGKNLAAQDKATKEMAAIKASLPDDVLVGQEKYSNDHIICFYICRKGAFGDFYDLDAVLAEYENLGTCPSQELRDALLPLFSYEIEEYARTHDYLRPGNVPEMVMAGLLLGYPIACTVAMLTGGVDLCEI